MQSYQMLFPCSSPDSLSMQAFNNFHGAGHMAMSSSSPDGVNVVPDIAKVKEVSPTTVGSEEINNKDDEAVKYNKRGEKKIKKPKFAFQTRSQVDILDDGYRWRKYGQKAVKNNKFPRSYYRCTQQGCKVKKQVQRLTKDEGIVETTYEGMHTHTVDKPTDNFEHILTQMQVYAPF